MILNNAVKAGNFIYCATSLSPYETNIYHNEGDGHYHQCGYIVDGYGTAEIKETADGKNVRFNDTRQPGQLIDLSDARGLYHKTSTQESGLSMLMFNPIPQTRKLDVEIVRGNGNSKNITATNKRITIVVITGIINVNGKEVVNMQHVKVFPGKSVEIQSPLNTVYALV